MSRVPRGAACAARGESEVVELLLVSAMQDFLLEGYLALSETGFSYLTFCILLELEPMDEEIIVIADRLIQVRTLLGKCLSKLQGEDVFFKIICLMSL